MQHMHVKPAINIYAPTEMGNLAKIECCSTSFKPSHFPVSGLVRTMYHIAGKFDEDFNLTVWRSRE